jgi:hypothetical protein
LTNLRTSLSDRGRFEKAFLPLANSALVGLGDDSRSLLSSTQPPRRIQFLGPEGQPFCNALVDLLKQSDAVIYVHGQLAKRTPQPSHIQDISTSFDGEKAVAAKTIHAGKHIVGTEMERLLADGFHEVRSGLSTLTAEEEQRGRLLLLRGMNQEAPEKQTRGWGNVARDTERAMEKLCFASKLAV